MAIIVGVIGAGEAQPQALDWAHEVGRLLAEAGATLVCGGRGGVMEAACQGCHEAGGLTVGVLPGADVAGANPYVRVPIATDMGQARNVIIAQTAHVLIAIDGEYGTLSEAAIGPKLGKTVVGLGPWSTLPGVIAVSDAQTAVTTALQAASAT